MGRVVASEARLNASLPQRYSMRAAVVDAVIPQFLAHQQLGYRNNQSL